MISYKLSLCVGHGDQRTPGRVTTLSQLGSLEINTSELRLIWRRARAVHGLSARRRSEGLGYHHVGKITS